MQHKRQMLKSRIRNHSGSFQRRSTSKRCCGGVPRSVLNPPQHLQVRWGVQDMVSPPLPLSGLCECPSYRGPASAADLCAYVVPFFHLFFLKKNDPKKPPKGPPKGDPKPPKTPKNTLQKSTLFHSPPQARPDLPKPPQIPPQNPSQTTPKPSPPLHPCKNPQFLKISVSPRRDTHFQGSATPENQRKSIKNPPGDPLKKQPKFQSHFGGVFGGFC